MASRGGAQLQLHLQLQLQENLVEEQCSKEFKEFGNTVEMWLGRPRATAQGYIYNYDTIKFGSNFQMHLMRC